MIPYTPFALRNYTLQTLALDSQALKSNPLGDPYVRFNPIACPVAPGSYKCVLMLSGFTGNGSKSLNFCSFESSFIEKLDQQGPAKAIFVFVDAWTSWGGSQFVNSKGCGHYEDYIVQELVPQIRGRALEQGCKVSSFVLMGGSSGGYGVLHLCSKHPELFPEGAAFAPDCDFELSLKPELFHAQYLLKKYGSSKDFFSKLKKEELNTRGRHFHTLVNALAMAACYNAVDGEGFPDLPFDDAESFIESQWQNWLKHDPLHFLPQRLEGLKKLTRLTLSVGTHDQFLLQYGARKLKALFESHNVPVEYSEFKGDHFDLSQQRLQFLKGFS